MNDADNMLYVLAVRATSPGLVIGLVTAGVVILVILVVIALERRKERLRTAALTEVLSQIAAAGAKGSALELSLADSEGHCDRLQEFRVGGLGRNRKIWNVIRGEWSGREILCCDYRYVLGHGKHQRSYAQTLMIMKLRRAFPPFVMAPEGFFAKIAQAFGAIDIDFLTHPEFSKSYVLKGKDEDEVRAAFSFDLLEYFEGQRGLTLESHDDLLLFYRAKKRCKPDSLEVFFAEGFEVLDALAGELPRAGVSGPEADL